VTVTIWPATLIVALRSDDVELIVNQSLVSVADQLHVDPAVTEKFVEPPFCEMLRVAGETEMLQPPLCVMVTEPPATRMLALRESVDGFDCTLKATVPLPPPDAPLVMLSQLDDSVAVQLHSSAAVTCTFPAPPAFPIV
jgi:hypothetical protein